jgi:hypothetical protein
MVTVVGDKVTALDLKQVVMISSIGHKESNSFFTQEELAWQESRSKRKIRKLEFEVR